MKRIIVISILLLYSRLVSAQPDEIHSCLAWLTIYDQTHNDQKTTLLRNQLESELKKSKVFNPIQLKEAYDDNVIQTTAAGHGRDTNRTLSYCSRLANDFAR